MLHVDISTHLEVAHAQVGECEDREVSTDNDQVDLNSYQLPIFEPLKVLDAC